MFNIEYSDFDEYKLVKLVNEKTGEYFSFLPNQGATINQLALKGKDGRIHELVDPSFDFERRLQERLEIFKGSKLFPFPNRINSGNYVFAEEVYQLPINYPEEGHAIHGLVLESRFTILEEKIEKGSVAATIQYKYDREFDGYPFKFDLNVTFSLSTSGFRCKTEVWNKDNVDIPVGDGWHPYFKTGIKVDDLWLSLPSHAIVEVDSKKIPTGKLIYNNQFDELTKIEKRSLDTCFKLSSNRDDVVINLVDKSKNLKICIWLESGSDKYQYVQIYIRPDREAIAIEPMTCVPNAFNNKHGLIVIPPGKQMDFNWGISLSDFLPH
ncbi:MAG: aldose 1-epimerase [Cytophagaceae bacterium]|nr:aldose 1-epimerase [Cytophagaceae bacterium]